MVISRSLLRKMGFIDTVFQMYPPPPPLAYSFLLCRVCRVRSVLCVALVVYHLVVSRLGGPLPVLTIGIRSLWC
jgi:hypothetical protein